MIGSVLENVRLLLDQDIKSRLTSAPTDPIINLGHISQLDTLDNLTGSILMSLVNLEQSAPLRNNPSYTRLSDTELRSHNPKIVLDLYVLFAIHQGGETDTTALNMLTQVIASLQKKNVFTATELSAATSPDDGILQTERAIFDLYSMTFEQLNHLWGILGGKYLPSVLYKVRLFIVHAQEDTGPDGVIRSIERQENILNP